MAIKKLLTRGGLGLCSALGIAVVIRSNFALVVEADSNKSIEGLSVKGTDTFFLFDAVFGISRGPGVECAALSVAVIHAFSETSENQTSVEESLAQVSAEILSFFEGTVICGLSVLDMVHSVVNVLFINFPSSKFDPKQWPFGLSIPFGSKVLDPLVATMVGGSNLFVGGIVGFRITRIHLVSSPVFVNELWDERVLGELPLQAVQPRLDGVGTIGHVKDVIDNIIQDRANNLSGIILALATSLEIRVVANATLSLSNHLAIIRVIVYLCTVSKVFPISRVKVSMYEYTNSPPLTS